MGYAAAQVGTRFLASEECRIDDAYKRGIVDARSEDIVLTNTLAGVDSSVIRTPDIERRGLRAGPLAQRMLRGRKTKKLMRLLYLLRASWRFKAVKRSGSAQYWQAGRGVDDIQRIEPARAIVERFAEACA